MKNTAILWAFLRPTTRFPLALPSAVREAGAALFIQVASVGIVYLAQILYARWMDPVEYGIYTYTYAWVQLLAVLGGLGLTTGVLRFIPHYLEARDWGRLHGVIRRGQQLTWMSGGLLAALGTGVLFLLPLPSHTVWPLLIGLWIIPLLGLSNLFTEMLRGTRHMVLAYAPPLLLLPVLSTIIVFVLRGVTGRLSGTMVISVVAVVLLVSLSAHAYGLRCVLPAAASHIPPVYETRLWLRVSLPLLFVTLCTMLLRRIDLIMVGLLLGQKAAGIYDAATKTAMLASFFLMAINAVVAPRIAALHARGDQAALQQMVNTVTQCMFWPSLVITVGIVFLGKPILALFGPEFASGHNALRLLAIGQFVNAATGPVGYLMSLTGYQDTTARILGMSVLVSLIFQALLIPFFGMVGAAFATLISMCLWNIWLCSLARRRLGIQTFPMLRFGL